MTELVPVAGNPFEEWEAKSAQEAREIAARRTRESVRPPAGRADLNELPSYLLAGAAPMALGGPLGAAAKTTISGAPKMTAAISGLLGAGMTPSSAADPTDIAGPPPPAAPEPQRGTGENWWRTKRTPMATAEPFRPPGLSPEEEKTYEIAPKAADWDKPRKGVPLSIERKRIADTREQDTGIQNKRTAAIEKKIESAQKDYAAAQAKTEEAYRTEQARLDKLDEEFRKANESFAESMPGLSLLFPVIGAALASRVPYGARKAAQATGNEMVDQMLGTIGRGRAATGTAGKGAAKTQQGALAEVEAQLGNVPKIPSTEMPVASGRGLSNLASGAATTAEAAVLPYEIDMARLPAHSHGREEANDPMNWLMRGGFGGLSGLLGARYGAELPLRGRTAVPPEAELLGLRAALKPTPKAPRSVVRKPATEDEVERQLRLIQQATGR